jgi:hypothetical protein
LLVSAGIFEGKRLEEMSFEFWERTMAVNVRATFLTVRGAVPSLRANGGGSIVIYTSTAGQRGSDIYSAYATSKGAQLLFMRSMARELAPAKIRVNCVAPGWTETDMSREALDEAGREAVVANIPMGRIGQPEDCAGAAASCSATSRSSSPDQPLPSMAVSICAAEDQSNSVHFRNCPSPRTTYLVVVSDSRPIGPRECSFCVEMPTSAPRPNSKTVAKTRRGVDIDGCCIHFRQKVLRAAHVSGSQSLRCELCHESRYARRLPPANPRF